MGVKMSLHKTMVVFLKGHWSGTHETDAKKRMNEKIELFHFTKTVLFLIAFY